MDPRAAIDEFLAGKRIAFVGLSTHEDDFSRAVLRELVFQGYDVVPVHPSATEIDGRRAYARVQEVPGPLDGALVMTPKAMSAQVVRDCIDANVSRVWLHRGAGPGAVSDEAVALCREHGITVVAGQCPLMFLPGSGVHRVHAAFKRVTGTYPTAAPVASLARRLLVLLAHGVLGWALCGLTMLAASRTLPSASLAVHAVTAPLWFAVVAGHYFRHHGYTRPTRAAAAFVAIVVALDALVVAPLLEDGYAMFRSPLGTWIPFALIFCATLVVGAFVQPHESPPNRHLPLAEGA